MAEQTDPNATPAQKREWLRQNNYEVATRGRLSAESEAAYASGQPADNPSGVLADPAVA